MSKERKALVKELDDIYSKYIRTKYIKEYGDLCPFCKKQAIQCNFHFFSRVSHSTRWLDLNCIGSCFGCNKLMEELPRPFYRWFSLNRGGEEKLDYLEALWHKSAKFSNSDLGLMIQDYKNKLDSLDK